MEKYGEIPKRFTKAWWSYFWDYYKWRVIGIAAVIILILGTAVQCALKVRYDMIVTYAGDKVFTDESIKRLETGMADDIDDITGNNKKDVDIRQITIAKEGTANAASEYNYGMLTKLDLEFTAGDSYLYLFSKQEMNRIMLRESPAQLFDCVDDWALSPVDSSMTGKSKGKPYVVNLKGNAYFENLGFSTDDLYLAVKSVRESDQNKPKVQKQHDNAVKLANQILGN